MYIQPALASGMTFGCEGSTPAEHILAYWIGPFLGVLFAIETNKRITLGGRVKKSDVSKEQKTMGQKKYDTIGSRVRRRRTDKRKA